MFVVTTLFYTGLWLYIAILVTFVFYLAVMNLSENRSEISLMVKILFAWPVVFGGYIADISLSLLTSLLALLIGDLPHEILFTSKMNRWEELGGIRQKIALWFCREMLNKFAPNNHHCRRN